ncbi:DUF2396 family protein [Alkalinema pantanalense]|uniref:DUF2396 family protein n=1 Tax=Alkalinema pantanalense TaxID=1620705 RepID=UPI003D6EC00E
MSNRCFTIFNRAFDMAQILGAYPLFGSEIDCPQCHRTIPALFLTDTYICPQHGAFEANPNTHELGDVRLFCGADGGVVCCLRNNQIRSDRAT